MWIKVEPAERQIINATPLLEALAERMNEQDQHRIKFEAEIDKANLETDEDLEIDDEPAISESEDGVWVGAWLYVAHEEPMPNIELTDEEMASTLAELAAAGVK